MVTDRFGPSLAELQIVLSIAHVVRVPFDVQHAIGIRSMWLARALSTTSERELRWLFSCRIARRAIQTFATLIAPWGLGNKVQ